MSHTPTNASCRLMPALSTECSCSGRPGEIGFSRADDPAPNRGRSAGKQVAPRVYRASPAGNRRLAAGRDGRSRWRAGVACRRDRTARSTDSESATEIPRCWSRRGRRASRCPAIVHTDRPAAVRHDRGRRDSGDHAGPNLDRPGRAPPARPLRGHARHRDRAAARHGRPAADACPGALGAAPERVRDRARAPRRSGIPSCARAANVWEAKVLARRARASGCPTRG